MAEALHNLCESRNAVFKSGSRCKKKKSKSKNLKQVKGQERGPQGKWRVCELCECVCALVLPVSNFSPPPPLSSKGMHSTVSGTRSDKKSKCSACANRGRFVGLHKHINQYMIEPSSQNKP